MELQGTYCNSKTSNEININADTHLRSSTRKKVGGRQSGKLWSWVLRRIKSNDQIADVFSGNRRSNQISSIVEEFNKRRRNNFDGASQWSLNDWISILAKGGGAKKRFQYCLTPNSSRHILYFRAIQWHSGSIALEILSCKTMHCYRKGLPNTSTTSGVWTKSQTRKTIRVLHDSEPNGRWKLCGGNFMRLDKPKDLFHTKRPGNLIITQKIGAIWHSLKRKDCCFPRQGRMQSFSTTHCHLFA